MLSSRCAHAFGAATGAKLSQAFTFTSTCIPSSQFPSRPCCSLTVARIPASQSTVNTEEADSDDGGASDDDKDEKDTTAQALAELGLDTIPETGLAVEVVVKNLLLRKDGHPDRAPHASAEQNEAIKQRTQRILAARAHLKAILIKARNNK
ncbi:hypothetical protein OAO87_04845 [bacterium]|nr:hypothetical protein [bacterium]